MDGPIFLVLLAILLVAIYLEVLPVNFASGLIVSMAIGLFLMWLGNQIPVVNTFGAGPILCILVPALFIYWGILPASVGELTESFYNEIGFSDFAVTGIIVGSILSMDRKVLVKVGSRFFIPLLAGVAAAFIVGSLVGHLVGFGFVETLFYVVGPVMGGGMAAGAVPMSEIYADATGQSAGEILAQIAPALMVANLICILAAGALNGLGKRNTKWKRFNGNGQMLVAKDGEKNQNLKNDYSGIPLSINSILIGMLIATTIFVFGRVVQGLFPTFHYYVYIILAAAALKICFLAI